MDEVDEKALVAFFVSLAESGIPTDVIAQELLLYGDNRSTVRPEAIKRAITAYLAAAGGGWRPIESAPKDGTRILGWMQFKDAYGKMNTGESLVVTYVEAPDKADYVWWTLDGYYHRDAFCFWHPLPAPPAQEPRNG